MTSNMDVLINNIYKKIMPQIEGGLLFGDEIKDDDIKKIIVSAYLLGKEKGQEESLESLGE